LANFLSIGNLLCGTLSIVCSVNRELHSAALLILTGVLFDFADGKTARFLGQASYFGKALDSLSDMVTFGIAPVAAGIFLLHSSLYAEVVMALFVSAGAWRLAYYIQWGEKIRPPGMPITMNGLIFPLLFLFNAPVSILIACYFLSTLFMVGPIFLHGSAVS